MTDITSITNSSAAFSDLAQPYHATFYAVYSALLPNNNLAKFNEDLGNFANEYSFDTTLPANFDIDNVSARDSWITYLQEIHSVSNPFYYSESLPVLLQTQYLVIGNKVITREMELLEEVVGYSNKALMVVEDLISFYNDKPDPVYRDADRVSAAPDDATEYMSVEAYPYENIINAWEAKYDIIFGNDKRYPSIDGELNTYNLYDYLGALKTTINEADPISTVDDDGNGISESNLSAAIQSVIDDLGPTAEEIANRRANLIAAHASDTSDARIISDWRERNWKAVWAVNNSIGRRLRDTISASENLNGDAEAKLKEAVWVFEEFYKSAGLMISKLNTISTKLSRRINK
ncbi:MAG: hypothetical protein HN831_03920 [Waddliaceae bacterium]|nr:hypothetical protein [Waddliaceae bacterium]